MARNPYYDEKNGQVQNGGKRPKFDYDRDDFYDEIFALAFNGATQTEIAYLLQDKLGITIDPANFGKMIRGNYGGWTKEENERRSARLCRVLAHAHERMNTVVRGRYLKAALGGIKVKSKTVTKRKMVIDGKITDNEIIQTNETESETAPNMQALATWLYHHDPQWRNIQKGIEEQEELAKAGTGVDVDAWLRKEAEEQRQNNATDSSDVEIIGQ